jgi:hypothetical protein
VKLTKEMIDKVRHIEGFPIGTDEDIIALYLNHLITPLAQIHLLKISLKHGKPYDEDSDEYHREPFASDVSEGKKRRNL